MIRSQNLILTYVKYLASIIILTFPALTCSQFLASSRHNTLSLVRIINITMSFNGELFEIMSWLPVKTLHRLSTMTKICKYILSEPYFTEKQCQNSCSKIDECLIIEEDSGLNTKVRELQFSFLSKPQSYNGIPKNPLSS